MTLTSPGKILDMLLPHMQFLENFGKFFWIPLKYSKIDTWRISPNFLWISHPPDEIVANLWLHSFRLYNFHLLQIKLRIRFKQNRRVKIPKKISTVKSGQEKSVKTQRDF